MLVDLAPSYLAISAAVIASRCLVPYVLRKNRSGCARQKFLSTCIDDPGSPNEDRGEHARFLASRVYEFSWCLGIGCEERSLKEHSIATAACGHNVAGRPSPLPQHPSERPRQFLPWSMAAVEAR